MGGSAFVITGKVNENEIKHIEETESILGLLLGKKKKIWPKIISNKNGEKFIELYTKEIEKELVENFTGFLKAINNPWQATTALINNYLSLNVLSLYLRGEQKKEETKTNWYLQFSFSGCAGMAEVSAKVSTHIMEVWYRQNKRFIDNLLITKLGFIPNELEPLLDDFIYCFPLSNIGYIIYEEEHSFYLENKELITHFDIDDSVIESFKSEFNDSLISQINDLILEYFRKQKRCYCQLCFSSFIVPKIKILM